MRKLSLKILTLLTYCWIAKVEVASLSTTSKNVIFKQKNDASDQVIRGFINQYPIPTHPSGTEFLLSRQFRNGPFQFLPRYISRYGHFQPVNRVRGINFGIGANFGLAGNVGISLGVDGGNGSEDKAPGVFYTPYRGPWFRPNKHKKKNPWSIWA